MRILVGLTGGIAAYKAITLVRLLTEQGHEVKVVPTANALRFVGATTLEAISHQTVDADLYGDVETVKHISLAQNADLVIVAPATASFLGKLAGGIADDLLGNVLLATTAPVVLAPAMHTEMWTNAATVANVETLRQRGYRVMQPATGRLTGEDSGVGRLPEPEDIMKFAMQNGPLAGIRFVITTGGTHEPIDSVRYIGNHSSGKQGFAIARAAADLGAEVTVIAANCSASGPFKVIAVSTVSDMDAALQSTLERADVLVMAAAVSDYRVAAPANRKLRKEQLGETFTITLIQNDDLLVKHGTVLKQTNPAGVVVGFAAEDANTPEQLAELGHAKLTRKNVDYLVANAIAGGEIFGADQTHAVLLDKAGGNHTVTGTKADLAAALVSTLAEHFIHAAK